MAITHTAVKAFGDKGFSSEWNAAHTITDPQIPKRSDTLIVAASDSELRCVPDYTCDGTADQVEINQAIAALPANGGSVMLLEGTFDLTDSITPDDNTLLQGVGVGTKITTSANVPMIMISLKNNVIVMDLYLYGAGTGNNTNQGVYLSEGFACQVKQVWIENCGMAGVQMTDGDSNKILNCVIFKNWMEGVAVEDIYDSVVGCTIKENYRHGVNILAYYNLIANNQVYDNDFADTNTYDGIYTNLSDYNVIVGNVCTGNDRYGINIAAAGANKNVVAGNCLLNNTTGGLNDVGTATEKAANAE